MVWLMLAAGFVLLFLGGEALVRGASRIAHLAGLTPLVIGVTVVAFGTSAPEVVVSVLAAARGEDGLSVGNVVGSNIFNVLFILGLCALIRPLVVNQQLVWRDVVVQLGACLLLWFFALDGRVTLLEGAMLLAALVLFVIDAVRTSRTESKEIADEYADAIPNVMTGWLSNAAIVAVGLALLVQGARWMVTAATEIALAFGVDETVVALTIVAGGTSAPELATSLVATVRGQRDIAVGNVVGSGIFNIFGIVGLSTAVGSGLAIPNALVTFDIPVMVVVAVALLPLLARTHTLSRWQGGLFLAYYVVYVSYLALAAKQHANLERFSVVMLEFVLPLTAATLIALVFAHRRARAVELER